MAKMRYSLSDGCATIHLDDGKANAMDFDFFTELEAALDAAARDEAQLILFTGRDGFFSGGLNIKLLPVLEPAELNRFVTQFAETMSRVYTFPAPTVAAITGHAIAGGLILALACDRRYACDGPFKLQMNEVAAGIPIPTWMQIIARAAVPVPTYTELIFHAKTYAPQDALAAQIVAGIADDVCGHAKDAAADLMELNSGAYAATKGYLRKKEVSEALEALRQSELPAPDA